MDKENSNLMYAIGAVIIIIITVTSLLNSLNVDVIKMINNLISNRQLKM